MSPIVNTLILAVIIQSMILLIAVIIWIKCQSWNQTEEFEFETMAEHADSILDEIYSEWEAARSKFAPFNSSHEGFAVLHEEFDELKAEVWSNEKKNPQRAVQMRAEAIQVAAMALRFITDICDVDHIYTDSVPDEIIPGTDASDTASVA